MRTASKVASIVSTIALAGCMVGPKYTKPPVATTPAYKEQPPEYFKGGAAAWKPAQPDDQELRGKWWEVFGDPQLNTLEEQVTVSNQDLKAAEARSPKPGLSSASIAQRNFRPFPLGPAPRS